MSSKMLICSKHSRHVTRRSRSRSRSNVDFLFLNHRHHQPRNMIIHTNNRVSRTGRDMDKEALEQEGTRHGGIVDEIPDGSKFVVFATSNSEWAH